MKEVRVFFEPYGDIDFFDAENMSEEEIVEIANEIIQDFLNSLDYGWEYVDDEE